MRRREGMGWFEPTWSSSEACGSMAMEKQEARLIEVLRSPVHAAHGRDGACVQGIARYALLGWD